MPYYFIWYFVLWNQRPDSMLVKVYDQIFLVATYYSLGKNLTLIEGLKFYRKLLFADFLSIYKWENFESLSNESLYMLFTTPVILIRLAKTGVVCLGFHDMHVRPQNENLMEKNWKRFLNSWPDIKRKLFHSLRVIFKHIQWLIL